MAVIDWGLSPASCQVCFDAKGEQHAAVPLFGSLDAIPVGSSIACLAYVGGPACALSWSPGVSATGSLHLAVGVPLTSRKVATGVCLAPAQH